MTLRSQRHMQYITGVNAKGERSLLSSGSSASLDFNFAANGYAGGNPAASTFTRASSGSAFDNTGTILYFPTNVPRITNRGLFNENSRTSNMVRSEEFELSANWNSSSSNNSAVVANQALAPDGNLTADFIYSTVSGSAQHILNSVGTFSYVLNNFYTFSCFFKQGSNGSIAAARYIQLTPSSAAFTGAISPFINYDLQTGTIALIGGTNPPTGTIEPYANGWYRCTLTSKCTTAASGPYINVGHLPAGSTGTDSRLPFHSITAGQERGVYAWGTQGEAGVSPTIGSTVSTYIPATTGPTTVRGVEIYTVPNSEFVKWYTNKNAGTLFWQGRVLQAVGLNQFLVCLNIAGSVTLEIAIYVSAAGVIIGRSANGADQWSIGSGVRTLGLNTLYKIAMAWQAGDQQLVVNGVSNATNASGTVVDLSGATAVMNIGARGDATGRADCITEIARYYPGRMALAQMINITS